MEGVEIDEDIKAILAKSSSSLEKPLDCSLRNSSQSHAADLLLPLLSSGSHLANWEADAVATEFRTMAVLPRQEALPLLCSDLLQQSGGLHEGSAERQCCCRTVKHLPGPPVRANNGSGVLYFPFTASCKGVYPSNYQFPGFYVTARACWEEVGLDDGCLTPLYHVFSAI